MKTSPVWVLTIATIKMWFRDRAAVFWSLLMPIIIMAIFGVINFGSYGSVEVGVVDLAGNQASGQLVEGLDDAEVLDVFTDGSLDAQRQALLDGDRHVVLIIPAGFGVTPPPFELRTLYNEARTREVEVAHTVIQEMMNAATFQVMEITPLFTLDTEPITDRDFSYIDYLLPGIVAMSIMQMGLFSVAFGFVQAKRLGILRRLFATPVRPANVLFAEVVTRLIVSAIQTLLLIGVAVLFFNAEVVGNMAAILAVAVVGGAVFLTMGFGIAGWAKNENVAAPLANVIAMPMMFLSGIFFTRDFLPDALRTVTDYLPLTYLADGLRNISTEGAALTSQGGNLLGLAVWLLISFALAARLFRWE